MLPLSPTGYGESPYQSLSSFAGNPLLISLERLVEQGWLGAADLSALPFETNHIDYATVDRVKGPLLAQGSLSQVFCFKPFFKTRFASPLRLGFLLVRLLERYAWFLCFE